MKKLIFSIITLISALFSMSLISHAGTLDSVDIYLKYDTIIRAVEAEQKAPTSITDAGEERIDTYTGGVSYYSEELNLPGKNGLDLIVGRKFNSAADIDIWGESQYVSVKDYRNVDYPAEGAKYVFPYHLNEDCTDDPIFIAFDTVWHMLQAENENQTITISSTYEDSAINIWDTSDDYNWGIDGAYDAGLTLYDDFYVYENIIGTDITLYRDLTKQYDVIWSSKTNNKVYIQDVAYTKVISLGGGWEYDVPVILAWDTSFLDNYECMYGMFYDSYQKDNVCFYIKYNGNKVLSSICYYTSRPITNSEDPSTKTKNMYTIEANIDHGYFYYTITRIDGVAFSFYEDELQTMTDRFGNTIYFDYTKTNRIIITDTLGRVATLTADGITANGEEIVSYTFDRYNNDDQDPNEYYYEDDWGVFTASYKVGSNSSKNIVYNHSQRARVFYIGGTNSSYPHTIGYSKTVLDEILLPTGAQRIYNYDKIDKKQYFNSFTKTDYGCIARYDLQTNSTTEENWLEFDYGEKSATPTTITSFPGRDGYTVSETFNSEGCLTTRVIVCEDADYTITEDYTYAQVDGSFKINTKTVEKTSSQGNSSDYTEEYNYDSETGKITQITRDGDVIYLARYSDYGILSREFTKQEDSFIGTTNAISIVTKTVTSSTYSTLSSTSSFPESQEYVRYTHDEYGNIASIDGDGVYVEYSYEYGDYSAETEPDYSIIITQTYPSVDNITDHNGTLLPSADITTVSYYDKWGNLVKEIDAEGNISTYTYDLLGRVLTVTNPDNTTKTYLYNDTTNKIYITNEDGSRNMVWYDSLGREYNYYYLNRDINAYSAIYLKRYNVNGQMRGYYLYSDRAVDSVIRYTYYSDGSLKSEILRDGESTTGPILAQNTYTYSIPEDNINAVHITRKMSDAENVIITNATNQYGHKLYDTVEGLGNTHTQSYTTDSAGNILKVTDFRDKTAHTYTYDYRGRILTDTRPIGSTTYIYDDANLYRVKDALEKVVKTYEYNTKNQLIRETTPIDDNSDNITEYYYDRNGNLTKTVSTTGDGTTTKTSTNIYDNRNRLIASDDGSGYYTRYEYDNGSKISKMATGVPTLTESLDRNIHSVTDYEYSYLGYLSSVTDPMGYTETYIPSSRGTILSSTDKNGTVTAYTYDGSYRLLSKTSTGSNGASQSISYSYDYLGNLTQIVDENGSIVYTYDELGNPLTETQGSLVKSYTYDANGNRKSALITNGTFEQSLRYTYDSNNRLTRLTGENGYTAYTYDKNNRVLTEKTYNNEKGAVCAYSTYTYYNSGMLNKKRNYTNTTTTSTYKIGEHVLTYHADGNIASVTDINSSVTSYAYDSANRLLSESIDDVLQVGYTYDAFGNRASMTTADGITTYTYDKNNRLTQSAGITYTYDNNGNLLSKAGTTSESFAFDLFGRMTASTVNNIASTYTYDANNIRTSKTVGGVTTNFINDGAYVVGEITADSTIKYTYGTDLISIDNNGTLGYYHTDEHGNVAYISDINRTTVATYAFDAFGNETSTANTYYNPMRYCGEYQDAESGLIYLRARYYDPTIGRFISEDPIKDGTNWYVYCNNNPINRIDPSGLKDYIYTSQTEYYVENDWGFWEFLNTDRYYAEIDGNRYQANSKETVTLYDWNSFDTDFLNGTLDTLVSTANSKSTDAKRILSQSVGGDLDFKLQMDKEKLYLANGTLYNRNEAGNYVWAYFLESKNVSGYISGALAQGGTILSPLINMNGMPRLDEEWDRQARWSGVKYYYDRNDKWWVYYVLYGGKPKY